MADYSQYNPANGFAGFNYSNLQDPIKRKQAAALALQQLGLAPTANPQFVQNQMGTFYAGQNGLTTGLSKLAAGLLSKNAADSANSDQGALDKTSNDALAYNLDPSNSASGQAARALQLQSEADAQMAREGRRGDYGQAPGTVDTSAPPVDTSAQPSPVAPGAVPPIPQDAQLPVQSVSPTAKKLATAALLSKPAGQAATPPAPGGKPSLQQIAAASLSNDPTALNPAINPDDPLGDAGSFSNLGSKVWGGIKSLYGLGGNQQPAPQQAAPVVPPQQGPALPPQQPQQAIPPQAPVAPPVQAGPAAPVVPPPQQGPVAPPQQPAPPVAPPAPTVDPITGYAVGPNGQAVGYNGNGGPQGDSRSMADQAAANAQMSQGDQLKQILAIGQTGPLGQQIATSQLNQMFGSKNGRFTTVVHNDTVNGGFVKVTTDSQTGNTSVVPIGSPTGKTLVTGQTTDADGNRLNMRKDGSTSPVLDSNGQPVKDAAVIKANNESTQKTASAISSNKSAIAMIDNAITKYSRINELADDTYTGVIGGRLPNLTNKRQEYGALLADNVFAATRDAVSSAIDSGGAPARMTQSEFDFMKDHGGLNQNMAAPVIHNLTAQYISRLQAMKQNLQEHQATLDQVQSNLPGAPTGVPSRRQSVTASQFGF